jgi:predicted transcriptional regulator
MEFLFGNKLRKKLFEYLFTHPEENFYLRELALNIEEDPGNLSRELKKLQEEGIISSTSRGKEKYFSINMNYPYYEET